MTKPYASEADIDRVALGVADRSLPKPEWTHAAHFAAALWWLRRRPAVTLETAMPPMIRAYNEATGVPNTDTDGYHETITIASIAAARAFLDARPAAEPLHEVLAALMAGPLGRSDWPLNYWSKAHLFSAAARRAWVDPDLRLFDPAAFGRA
jgi:hypothetical protein